MSLPELVCGQAAQSIQLYVKSATLLEPIGKHLRWG